MVVIIGSLVVIAAVIGGYLEEGGNLSLLWQPAEFIIIGGASIGMLIIASPIKVLKATVAATMAMLKGKSYSKADYMEILVMMNEVFVKIRKEGLVSIESDVDTPANSPIFSKYPKILANHHALSLVTDTLRTVMTTSIAPYELEGMLDKEIESIHEEHSEPGKVVTLVADSLPGLGIVACVLGVVLTMQKISEPPAILGKSIGAALVGTFLGILLSYGFVGPMSKVMEAMANEDMQYMNVFKIALVSFVGGAAPQIAVEFSRRAIPPNIKPSFVEVEEALRAAKK